MLVNITYAEGNGHNVVASVIMSIAVNVCGDIYVASATGSMFGIGLAIFVFYGEHNEDSIKQLMHFAVVFSMTMCLGVLAVSFFAVGPLVGLNTDNSSIAGLAERGR